MNLFVVPSWYPSDTNPIYGIFVKEQMEMLARQKPDWEIGISRWGQGDAEKLIWVKDHVKNIRKINKHGLDKSGVDHNHNITEYYQPALSWTKKFRKGNLREVIRCNELNYQAHSLAHGKPDFILVQACYPGAMIAEYLSKKYDVPVHQHIHLGGFMFENLLSDLASMKKDLLKAISGFERVTATSSFHVNELEKWLSCDHTLFNPVDLDFFRVANGKSDYALAIGRLEHEKGFDLLIEAIKTIPELKLIIAGSGSEQQSIQYLIDQYDLNDRVELLGMQSREEVKTLIQKCQFLILPSRYETFGNVVVEAMACGKPIVATKCGGPEELVSREVGYLAAIDSKDLSDRISKMLNDFESFDPAKIRREAEKYSPKNWVERLEAILR